MTDNTVYRDSIHSCNDVKFDSRPTKNPWKFRFYHLRTNLSNINFKNSTALFSLNIALNMSGN